MNGWILLFGLMFTMNNLFAISKFEYHNISAATEVLYDNDATLYLRFTEIEGYNEIFYLAKGDSFIDYLDLVNNEIIHEDLELNTDYIVYIEQGYDNIPIYQFTTSFHKGQPIYVSDHFLNKMAEYDKTYSNSSFYKFLTAIPEDEVHHLEILSFIQKFYYKGIPLPTSGGSRFIPFDKIPRPLEGECNCEYILNISQNPGLSFLSNPVPSLDYSGKIPWDNKSRYWYSTSWVGPVKFQKLNSEGKRSHSKYFNYETSGNGNISPKYFELGFLLRCLNYLDIPRECECEKEVKLRYQYDVSIETKNKLPKCFLCGSKGSESSGEDWVVLTRTAGDTDISILDAGNARLESHCKANWNKDWWHNLVDIASSIAETILQPSTPGPQIIKTVGDGIKSLINTSFYSDIGCSNGKKDDNLIFGSTTFNLKANEENWIRLFSFSTAQVHGYTSWENEVIITSDALLSSIIPGPSYNDPDQTCCSDQLGSYQFMAYNSSPVSYQSLFQTLLSHHDLYNPWNTQIPSYGIGVRVGPPPEGCLAMDNSIVEPKWQYSGENSDLKCFKYHDQILMKGNSEKENLYYSLWDINGRLLHEGNTSASEDVLVDNTLYLPYTVILTLRSKDKVNTYKILNH